MQFVRALGLGFVFAFSITYPALAELFPTGQRAPLLSASAPLIEMQATQARVSPSLFNGRSKGGLFALREQVPAAQGPVAALLSLIAKAEAGPKGYDAVQYGAWVQPNGPPTTLTIGEIYQWIDETPGMPHAIGRYQFIPPTLRRLVRELDLPLNTRFSPAVQDALADLLLKEAGIDRFLSGGMERRAFMNNLAKIWAGLPNHTGRSHYHGYAGNKATMTWTTFDRHMARIFPG